VVLERIEARLAKTGGGQVARFYAGDEEPDRPLISAHGEQLGLAKRTEYTVWLNFDGESEEAFYARYPAARGHRHKATSLSFGIARVPLSD
jgi:hypothetical protein